jgi:hypothetical protein
MNSPIKHTQRSRLSNLSITVAMAAVTLLVILLGLQAGGLAYALPANIPALTSQDTGPTVVATVTTESSLEGVGVNTVSVIQDGALFSEVDAGLTGVWASSVAWGDYDNDGRLDILLTGGTYTPPVAKIYHNNGNGTFTDIGAGLRGVDFSSVAWGDYDNDGRLDILLTGEGGYSTFIAKVYHNNGDGTFTDINAGLPGVVDSSVAWGDYDNDGRLDILLTGSAASGYIAKVYHNNGDGTFTDIGAGLTGVYASSVAWGDYDNDGRLDILLTGSIGYPNSIAKVYHNNSNGTFTDIGAGLTGVEYSSVAWGDYDNDGWLDILLTGYADTPIRESITITAMELSPTSARD